MTLELPGSWASAAAIDAAFIGDVAAADGSSAGGGSAGAAAAAEAVLLRVLRLLARDLMWR